jgi:hypothetical protein
MATTGIPQLAELMMQSRFQGAADAFRSRRPFSPDMEAVHAVLFSARYDRQAKIRAYRAWLEKNQPCVFGKTAATNKNVYICLIEEHEVLRMARGDADLMDTLQDHRQAWKRLALEGLASSFVILLTSKHLVTKEPNAAIKEICRKLLELYMQVPIKDDTFLTEREYVFLRRQDDTILKFATLPNVFCAQGDGRWWHDHRTPGGIMIRSNALGHFMYARTKKTVLDQSVCASALEQAMRTIANAKRSPSEGRAKYPHCPATFLVSRSEGDPTPLRSTSEFNISSPDHYAGYFHTDHLIPSVFFQKDRDPKVLQRYDDLSFRYIFDPSADPEGHAELVSGMPAKWYDVKSNIDRLPGFLDPEKSPNLDRQTRGRLAGWLEERIRQRF